MIWHGKIVENSKCRLTDTGEDSKLVYRRKSPKVDTLFSSSFRRVRATSMTQRRVGNTRVHFWTFSPVSVKTDRLLQNDCSKVFKTPKYYHFDVVKSFRILEFLFFRYSKFVKRVCDLSY